MCHADSYRFKNLLNSPGSALRRVVCTSHFLRVKTSFKGLTGAFWPDHAPCVTLHFLKVPLGLTFPIPVKFQAWFFVAGGFRAAGTLVNFAKAWGTD